MSGFRNLLFGLTAMLWIATYVVAGNKSAVKSCWTATIVSMAMAGMTLLSD